MKFIINQLLASLLLLSLLTACSDQPKVITATDGNPQAETGIFTNTSRPPLVGGDLAERASSSDVHTVIVEDILPTSKYIYLYVKEKGQSFWIATTKQEVEVGETYYYKGGLLKTNFLSQEHNRTFDKVYLVSRIVPINHGTQTQEEAVAIETHGKDQNTYGGTSRQVDREGSVRIAEIVSDPAKYEGQTIQISAECVKVNPNIMGRNWMHLKDGSQDDYDLVITSDRAVPEGHVVTFEATVALNKDFGAGYHYDIILENGVLLP